MPTSNEFPLSAAELAFVRHASQSGTPFLLVGLAAAVLQGADAVTQDLDLWFRSVSDPRVAEAARHAGGILIWRTTPPLVSGPDLDKLDLVVHCDGLASFDEEFVHAVDIQVADFKIKALPLERIIASKKAANRDKDRAVLPALRAALAAIKA